MPREYAAVNVAIWTDPEFCALPPAAQHLYLLLWTSPGLSHCGVHDWRPGRLAARSVGFTAEHITVVADCLEARYFLVIDEATEEALVRSWGRFDGLMKQPRMAVSYANAFADVASQKLRQVLAHETMKIRKEMSGLACWGDERVSNILDYPAVSAKDLPTPEDPFGDGFTPGLALGLPQTQGDVWPRVSHPPTPAPTPAPVTSTPKEGAPRKRAASKLPEDWKPTEKHWERRHDGIDVKVEAEKFRLHAEANDRRQANWNASFSQWLLNSRPSPQVTPARQLPMSHELELPPDGLTPEEYAAWERESRARRQAR